MRLVRAKCACVCVRVCVCVCACERKKESGEIEKRQKVRKEDRKGRNRNVYRYGATKCAIFNPSLTGLVLYKAFVKDTF